MPGYNKRFVETSIEILGGKIPSTEGGSNDETTARISQESFSQDSREFHDPDHKFLMAAHSSPELKEFIENRHPEFKPYKGRILFDFLSALQILQGAFHDVVYFQVDSNGTEGEIARPVIDKVGDIIDNYVFYDEKQKRYYLKEEWHLPTSEEDKIFHLVLDLFARKGGDSLGHLEGGNEFLSAVVAAKQLEKTGMPMKNIAQVIHGIVATIPFKPQEYYLEMENRIMAANNKYNLGMSVEEVEISSIVAVDTANRDISSFAFKNFEEFIENTEKVIGENMGNRKFKTPFEFSSAFKKQIDFFEILKANYKNVFHHFHGWYPEDKYEEKSVLTKMNIEDGIVYLKAKAVSSTLVAAIATIIDEPHISLLEFISKNEPLGIKPEIKMDTQSKTVFEALGKRSEGALGLMFQLGDTPIGEAVFAACGKDVILGIYNAVDLTGNLKGDFMDKETAVKFIGLIIKYIGVESFRNIGNGIIDVAKDPEKGKSGESNLPRAIKLDEKIKEICSIYEKSHSAVSEGRSY